MIHFTEPIVLNPVFTLPSRVILSPLEGIMNRDFFFRTACSQGLIDSWIPPFIGVPRNAAPSKGALRRQFRTFLNSDIPFTAQLLGKDADALAETAYRLHEIGVGSVNLNFACPSRTVIGSGSGGLLLNDPDQMNRIVSGVKLRIPEICLSVKLRSGFASASESVRILESVREHVSWVIFHFRTVSEHYDPVERAEALERIACGVRAAGNTPLFGNGDIQSVADARNMADFTRCAGVAVGRGFLKNPFLLKEIRGMSSDMDARPCFLKELLARAEAGSGRRRTHFYLECVRMSYGADSAEFRDALKTGDPNAEE